MPEASSDAQWFTAIPWSAPHAVETLRRGGVNRDLVPKAPGVYAFTLFDGPITLATRLGVLYVGKATTLRSRMKSYMADPATLSVTGRGGQLSTSLKHAGKVGLLVQIQQRSRGAAPSRGAARSPSSAATGASASRRRASASVKPGPWPS